MTGYRITKYDPMFRNEQGAYQMLVDPVIIARVVRLILPEFLWCKLESKTGLYFHFGYDYYMYCGGLDLTSESRDAVTEFGSALEDSPLHI